MRIFPYLFLLFSLPFTLKAQEVVASDGNYSSSSQGSLSWTLGEMISETASSASGIFTQGFQQNYEDFLDLPQFPGLSGLEIYPNPFTDAVHLVLPDSQNEVNIELSDVHGRVLLTSNRQPLNGLTKQKIDLHFLLPGTYFLRVIPQDQTQAITFPIIKAY